MMFVCVCVHLREVDVLCSCEVEPLLVALMLQQALCQSVGHLDVTAKVCPGVLGGVGQHGGRLLDLSRVQE